MACGTAFGVVPLRGFAGRGRRGEGSGCGVVVEHGVAPSVGVCESLAILLDKLHLNQVARVAKNGSCQRRIFFGGGRAIGIMFPDRPLEGPMKRQAADFIQLTLQSIRPA